MAFLNQATAETDTGKIFAKEENAHKSPLPDYFKKTLLLIREQRNKNSLACQVNLDRKILGRAQMIALLDQMLELHKQLPEAKTGHEQTLIQRQIDATDREIDKLVYELYGLTPEEIAIVEGAR